MSNLGWYQVMTTIAKKVGGPKQLFALVVTASFTFGGTVTAGVIAIKEKISTQVDKKKNAATAEKKYTVKVESQSKEGLLFKAGDTFRILETDGDAGLIEIIGDENNPYFVSLGFLQSISDYNP